MDQSGVTQEAHTNNSFRPSSTLPSGPEQRTQADPVSTLGAIGAITVLITALFYYFGWVRTNSFLGYFGVEPSLAGYSTADYVLRSINVAFHPFMYAAFAALVLLGFHRLVIAPALARAKPEPSPPSNDTVGNGSGPATPCAARSKLRRTVSSMVGWVQAWGHWRPGPSSIRHFMGPLRTVAIALAATVFIGVLLPEQIGASLGILLPLSLLVSVTLFGYVAHLRSRYPEALAATTSPRPTPPFRIYTLILLALGLVAGLWAVSLYGVHVGTRLATDMVTQLPTRSGVVIYSTERIALHGPGIIVAEITQPGTKYRYQYTGLRLLTRSPDKFLLLPSGWQRGRDSVLVLRDNDSVRVDIIVR